MFKKFAVMIMPKFITSAISISRKYKNSKNKNEELKKIGEEIKPHLMKNTIIIPNRKYLLDYMPKDGFVAEIGVSRGIFSKIIIEQSSPRALHLIDRWSVKDDSEAILFKNQVETNFSEQISSGTVKIHQGLSWEVLEQFPDSYFDWVYVDAGHSYQSVIRDLEMCYRKVKNGGYICGDDYITWTGGLDRFGVVEAVNEFINKTESPLIYLTNEKNRHLNYAIRIVKNS